MAEGGGEKSSLGQFVKNQTKYGATKKVYKPQETYIVHSVEKGETLQGIALNYGVSMEQIKRVNKLWTNDSLYLRDTLQIPIPKSVPSSMSLDNIYNGKDDINNGASTSQSSTNGQECNTIPTQRPLTKSKSEHSCLKSKTASGTKGGSGDDMNAKDFLSQFDSSLALVKTNVEKMMCNTNIASLPEPETVKTFATEDPTNPLSLLPSKKRFGSKHRAKTMDLLHPSTSPELHIRSPLHSRRLRKNMEKTDTEIFEL